MKGFRNELHGGQQANCIVDWIVEWGFLQKTFKKKAEDNKWSSSDLTAWQSRQLATFQGSATQGLASALVGWKTLNDISAVVNYVKERISSISSRIFTTTRWTHQPNTCQTCVCCACGTLCGSLLLTLWIQTFNRSCGLSSSNALCLQSMQFRSCAHKSFQRRWPLRRVC